MKHEPDAALVDADVLHSTPVPQGVPELETAEERERRLSRMRGHQTRTLATLVLSYMGFCVLAQIYGYIALSSVAAIVGLGGWLAVFSGLAAWILYGQAPRNFGTLVLWSWGFAGVLGMVSMADPLVHPILLAVCLFGTLLGAQYVPWQSAFAVNSGMVVGYALIIYARTEELRAEGHLAWVLLLLAALIVTLIVATMLSNDLARLRMHLHERNQALRNALSRLQELAVRDELTGLYNRRYVMSALNQQKALADRGGHGFAVAYLDLDYFKQVNDALGHEQGDRTLKLFARILSQAVREADCVARFGGEEFVLVLVGAGEEEAALVAERIRTQFEQAASVEIDGNVRVTTSVGVTRFRAGEDIDTTLGRADRALYSAKRDGRNRVVVEVADTEPVSPDPGELAQ